MALGAPIGEGVTRERKIVNGVSRHRRTSSGEMRSSVAVHSDRQTPGHRKTFLSSIKLGGYNNMVCGA